MKVDVIILAGGLGTRLRSAVPDKPKCMATIGDKPFLYYLLKQLQQNKLHRVILSVGYLKELVKDYIESITDEFDMEFCFVEENEPLGTGGAVRLAMQQVQSNDVMVCNGDTLFDIDFSTLYEAHMNGKALCTLALKPMQAFDRYGSVHIDAQGSIVQFNEKQYCEQGLINGGIYCINREMFESINLPEKCSFEKSVLESRLYPLKASVFESYFIDIGIPEDYNTAQTTIPQLFK